MAARTPLSSGATKALGMFEENIDWHTSLRERTDRLVKAYEGKLEIPSDAATWTSKLHPPYVNHITETTISGLVDDRLAFRVKPAPRFYNPGEFQAASDGAKAHEILARYQMKQDGLRDKTRPFALQAAIARFSVAKTYWRSEPRTRKRLELNVDPVTQQIKLVPTEYQGFAYQGPCTEVCDVRDWGIDEAAVDIASARFVWHRTWETIETLRKLEKQGVFSNVGDLDNPEGHYGSDEQGATSSSDPFRRRTRNRIEVLEIWYQADDGTIRVCTLADRRVEIRPDRPNPFWHGKYPFTLCSIQPGLFQLGGVSMVEKIMHLQEATWDLMNQTHDNVRLINNAITILPDDMLDTEREYMPGAQWVVEGDANRVKMWNPDPISAQIALPHLGRLEQQMQNLAGSQPFTTTSEGTMNASTATQASLVTNLAQRSLAAQKNELYKAYQDIGQQRLELSQQFIRTPQIIEVIGLDSQPELVQIAPMLLQGEYLFDIEPMAESQFRSERKAEAQAMLQMALAAAPVMAAYSQAGAGKAINLDRAYEDFLKANDVQDTDPYFLSAPAPAPPQQGQGQPGMGGPQDQGPGGVTGPQSIDPATSPSNQSSISPEVFLQRALAARGGANNT